MKLLLFSDLHCDGEAARRLVTRAERIGIDVAVGAGDFATKRRGIERTIDVLRELPCPSVLVPGNSETDEELRRACHDWPSARVLHGSGTRLGGVAFFGLGGAVPVTPFGDWSFDLTEDAARDLLRDCPSPCVLVSHSPPRGVLDVSSRGTHLGSEAVRECIEKARPWLVVCGHIHDCGGRQDSLGGVPVVNAGPDGMVWELAD